MKYLIASVVAVLALVAVPVIAITVSSPSQVASRQPSVVVRPLPPQPSVVVRPLPPQPNVVVAK